ncbi:MAG: hypothetical protein WDN28_19910 [Chthoniobacter sp.]
MFPPEGGDLHFQVQASAGQVVELGGKAAHIHIGIERQVGNLDRRVLNGGRAAHVAEGAVDPRLLEHDLPGADHARFEPAEREIRIGQAHVIVIALEDEIHVLRLDAIRRRHPPAARSRQAPAQEFPPRRSGAGPIQRELDLAIHAAQSEPLEDVAGGVGEQIAPVELRLGRLDFHPRDGAGIALINPHGIPHRDGLEHAAVDRADVGRDAGAPGLEGDDQPHEHAEAIGDKQRDGADDDEEERQAQRAKTAARPSAL